MAGYIGKSLAAGGTAVDAYSKTQTDAAYLKLTGGLMTGGIRQGVLSVSADTTITTAHPNVILVTTASTDRTMTLPSASTVGGQVYRFTKVDSGTGKVIIARAGSDTMGINANLTMELWFQDNYVDLMSDGTSRWIVVGTEMFHYPVDRRNAGSADPNGVTTLNTWTDANYSTGTQIVPAGTSNISSYIYVYMTGDGALDNCNLFLRKNGSSVAHSTPPTSSSGVQHYNLGSGLSMRSDIVLTHECDIGRIFEWYLTSSPDGGTINLYMYTRGYRLG